MSFTAARVSKPNRVRRAGLQPRRQKNCQSCRERKARFAYRGVVRADRDHTLCFERFRSERDRRRARTLAAAPKRALPYSPFGTRLTERQVAHRQAMLEFASIQVE